MVKRQVARILQGDKLYSVVDAVVGMRSRYVQCLYGVDVRRPRRLRLQDWQADSKQENQTYKDYRMVRQVALARQEISPVFATLSDVAIRSSARASTIS